MAVIQIDVDGVLRNFIESFDKNVRVDFEDRVDEIILPFDSWSIHDSYPMFSGNAGLHKYMYDEKPFEIFGRAGQLPHDPVGNLNRMINLLGHKHRFQIVSQSKGKGKAASMYWLGRHGCTISNVHLVEDQADKIFGEHEVPDIIIEDSGFVVKEFLREVVDNGWVTPYGTMAYLVKPESTPLLENTGHDIPKQKHFKVVNSFKEAVDDILEVFKDDIEVEAYEKISVLEAPTEVDKLIKESNE